MTTTAHLEPRPPAGALRIVRPRATMPPAPDGGDAAAVYVEATTAHCPYLAPSIQQDLTGWTTYRLAPGTRLLDAEAAVFAAAVQAAEVVRVLASRPPGHLVCENVVVLGAGRRHLDWPHWALKNLYGPVGLMVGKFWEGETDTNCHGRPLPVPPLTFLSLRPAVRPRDPRFLNTTPELAAAVTNADDSGRDVLAAVTNARTTATAALIHWPAVRAWAAALPEEVTT
ncbi:hypothetical protein [Kitasatospora herbaricolor]|uniref:hypothetical protein n=1 Tax=Kitasatospora herbaricolor TaxID=68217 RepID=UPI0036DF49C4